jgi:hypothetical protein
MDRLGVPDSKLSQDEKDEAIIEARTLLLTASRNGPLTVVTHSYMRNWIARRMDVVAIDESLLLATLCAPFIAWVIGWVICRHQPGPFSPIDVALISISTAVILTMLLSICVLRRQVVKVIEGIYRTYR